MNWFHKLADQNHFDFSCLINLIQVSPESQIFRIFRSFLTTGCEPLYRFQKQICQKCSTFHFLQLLLRVFSRFSHFWWFLTTGCELLNRFQKQICQNCSIFHILQHLFQVSSKFSHFSSFLTTGCEPLNRFQKQICHSCSIFSCPRIFYSCFFRILNFFGHFFNTICQVVKH